MKGSVIIATQLFSITCILVICLSSLTHQHFLGLSSSAAFLLFLLTITTFPLVECIINKEKDFNLFAVSCLAPLIAVGADFLGYPGFTFGIYIFVLNFVCVCYCLATAKQYKTRRIH